MLKITDHAFLLRHSIAIAKSALKKGNLPFGCLLAGPDGTVLLEGENKVITSKDAIAHCEIELVHALGGQYSTEFLEQCTIYASTEPCPMCAAAIFWAGIGTIVYALGKEKYHHVSGTVNPAHIFDMNASTLLSHGGRKVKVLGPLLEDEAAAFYTSLH